MNLDQLKESYNLTGKTIVLTGGNGILGTEMALAAAGCGANVAILDLNTTVTEETQEKINGVNGRIKIFLGNVLNREQMIEA
ncbi:MAG: hypothetical protein JXB44_02365, partial [Calditrichaceae bacterium]